MSDPPSPYHESEPLVGKMFRVLYLNNPALIEPGSRDDHIECNLSPTSLGQHPQFTALSYCWDVPEPKVPILCNGVKLQVRPNLQSALRQLRLPEKQVCIWADALCINQDDLEERVRQVKFMKEIFEAAAEVIVWLGDESDDSDIGMQAAKELADAARKYLEQRDTIYNMPADDPLVEEIFGKFRRGSEYPRFHALSQILNRNWFHRTWVVQEAAVARKLKILCGGSVMTWEDFTLVASLRSQLNLTTSANDKNVTPLILANTRLDYQNGVSRDLLSIMYRHRVFEATVPRDKVYGLGGLAGDDIAKHFMANVDYAGHEFVLYREVAAEMLKRGQLGVLSVAPGLNREHADGLPTWAPDWRVTRQSPCVGLWNEHDIHLVRYKASGDSEPSVRFDDAGSLLGLECCRVDTIEAVGDIMIVEDIPHGFPGILRLPKFAYMLDNWRQVTRTSQSAEYPTSEPIADAFVQTLVGGPPEFHIDMLRQQYDLITRQASLLRWMNRLSRFLPPGAEKFVVPALAKILKVPHTSVAFAFGKYSAPLADRAMFRTEKGYMGLGSVRAAPGDVIAVPKGGKVPLVLRRDGDVWKLRGDCYLHGVMYGEAYKEDKLETMWIA